MLNPETPRRLQRHVLAQRVGAETLVYDERRHQAFCLNESSSAVWRLADGEHTIAQIKAAASGELRAQVSEEFVLFALEGLRRDGLLEPWSPTTTAPAISRRTMLQRIGVGGALLVPAVAAIVAPTAAQAYNGCVDCTSSAVLQSSARKRQLKAEQLAARGGSTVSQPTAEQ